LGRTAAGVLAVGVAILAGQLSIGWLNDFVDAERDRSVERADKPVAAGRVSRRAVGVAAGAAAAVCVPLSLLSGVPATVAHLVAVASAWSYNLGLKGTAVSVVPYAVSFGLLPAIVVLGLPGHPAPAVWLVAASALLGSAAHFANVLPDLERDAVTGVRGLPQRLGAGGAQAAAALLLVGASAVLALGPPGPPTWLGLVVLAVAAVTLAVGLLLQRRPRSRAIFRAVMIVAILDVSLFVASGTLIR
jgi:4-hydroxybenzoate polyprenyltransferase